MTDHPTETELTDRAQPSAARLGTVNTIVLVEGISDGIAIQTLAARAGRDLENERVSIMPIGGATSIRRYVEQIGRARTDCTLAGLCDVREARFFRAALDDVFVCVSDLEDELIRALGAPAVEGLIDAEGELASFRIMQKQPDQRTRTIGQQLRRFMGTRSGRKARYARVLVDALEPDRVPPPLDRLLAHI
jgi:hypothetical protein